MAALCPCYSGKHYADCCQPLHQGTIAPDAERLMRARYSAYALKLPQFLNATWHPATRPKPMNAQEMFGIRWLKLTVHSAQQISDTEAQVCFSADYRQGQQKRAHLYECSRFVREEGQWWYWGALDDSPQDAKASYTL